MWFEGDVILRRNEARSISADVELVAVDILVNKKSG